MLASIIDTVGGGYASFRERAGHSGAAVVEAGVSAAVATNQNSARCHQGEAGAPTSPSWSQEGLLFPVDRQPPSTSPQCMTGTGGDLARGQRPWGGGTENDVMLQPHLPEGTLSPKLRVRLGAPGPHSSPLPMGTLFPAGQQAHGGSWSQGQDVPHRHMRKLGAQ